MKDGTHGSHKDGNYSMLLSTKNLVGGKVVFDKMIDRKIGKEDYQSIFKGYTLQSEDILLSVVGSIGRVSVYQPVDVPIAFQRSVAILRSKGQLIQGFLRYSLETYKIQHQMKMKTTISAQPDLFLGDLGQITITFPNIKTQVKITKILNNITETIASNQRKGKSSNKDGISTYKLNLMETTRSINYRVNQNPQLTNNYSKINVLNILVSP